MYPCLPVRVVVADDHPLVRAGVVATLSDPELYLVVGQAKNSVEALSLVSQQQPHLLILDLHMEDFRPACLIADCFQARADLRILIFSARSQTQDLAPLQHLGIHGFVAKDEGPEQLLQAVRTVMSGERWFSLKVSQQLHALRKGTRKASEPLLSPRERQVLDGIVRAKGNQAIAEEMQISKNTVRRYVTQIFEKLGAKNRMEVVVWVNRQGMPEARS